MTPSEEKEALDLLRLAMEALRPTNCESALAMHIEKFLNSFTQGISVTEIYEDDDPFS